ncbi:MAG: GNAT family N-acetyltransferase [[Clostridium] leptum]
MGIGSVGWRPGGWFQLSHQLLRLRVRGKTLMIEEIYLKESCRGKGFGRQFFRWLFQEYPQVKRFRLEVTKANAGAAKLYASLGFVPLEYNQMILDRE